MQALCNNAHRPKREKPLRPICASHTPDKAPAILENLPPNTRRVDVLGVAQLPAWWQGVEQLSNRTASAYLKALVLTGARKEEMAALTWVNVDFRWRKLTLADKGQCVCFCKHKQGRPNR